MALSAPWWKHLLSRIFIRDKPVPAGPAVGAKTPVAMEDDGLDDPRAAIIFGYSIIFFGLIVTAVWAGIAPLGEGISSPGVVVVESRRKAISHLTGGIVTVVNVRENQSVKEGDVLLELDSVRARSARDTVLHEYIAAVARLTRLTGEQTFATTISFPADVVAYAKELGREDLLLAQQHLFQARQAAFRGELSILRESMTASRIQATGARNQLYARRKQVEILGKEIAITRPLVDEGYTPRNRLYEQERQLAELSSVTSELEARVAREGSTGAEIRLRELQRRQEYLKDVETQSTETRREVANLTERLKDTEADLNRMIVRAPLTGQVVAMIAQAPGVVIAANSKLMEIVPVNEKLLIDVQVPLVAASRVKADLETDIRITSFPNTPAMVIQGRVQSVSTDRYEPPAPQNPYYLARVEVTPEGIAKLEGRQLRPGMSVDVIIKTGERSFLRYLMAPIAKQLYGAFREP